MTALPSSCSSQIHPTAIVDKNARLGKGVLIGPYCCVGPNVTLEDDVHLLSHVVIEGHVTIGSRCKVYPFATIGLEPQHLHYKGEPTLVEIGSDSVIREQVTIHRGTKEGRGKTVVGSHCLIMVGVHVAHDSIVGDHVVMANNATLGGHVVIEDYAVIGGMSAIHQYVRIGAYAMIGGMSGVEHDVIPYGLVMGERARLQGLNLVGLKRRGFSAEAIRQLKRAYSDIFEESEGGGVFTDRVETVLKDSKEMPEIAKLIHFIRGDSKRNLCQPIAEPSTPKVEQDEKVVKFVKK